MNDDIVNWSYEQLSDGWSEADKRSKEIYQIKKSIEEEMHRRVKEKMEQEKRDLQIK